MTIQYDLCCMKEKMRSGVRCRSVLTSVNLYKCMLQCLCAGLAEGGGVERMREDTFSNSFA